MEQRRTRRALALLVGFLASSAAATASQAAPSGSRGEQFLPITEDECMDRARQAFMLEGWQNLQPGPRFIFATRDIHAGYIMCNNIGGGQVVVNIVVASEYTSDGAIPAAERELLQKHMGEAPGTGAPSKPAPAP
ncbi:MAG: hypothetical protein ACHP84_05680 [Caulobacterales bacterium]